MMPSVTGGHIPTQISLWPSTASLAVSVVVGVLSGLYPSWRAGRLDPIEALRHE